MKTHKSNESKPFMKMIGGGATIFKQRKDLQENSAKTENHSYFEPLDGGRSISNLGGPEKKFRA